MWVVNPATPHYSWTAALRAALSPLRSRDSVHTTDVESDWERRERPIHLDLEGARRILSGFSFEVSSLALILEGKANANYRIETSQGPFLLSLEQGRKERADFSFLAPEGVPVPSVVARGPGFGVYAWKPGTSLEKALIQNRELPFDKIARQLAEVRNALDAVTCESAGFFDRETPESAQGLSEDHDKPLIVKDAWPSAIEGLFGWLRHILSGVNLARTLKTRVTSVIKDAEPRLQAIVGPPVLVHGDFKPSNLLVDETGLTAVLDWEFAHAGTYLSDVGQLLRHPETLPPGFIETFLDTLGLDADAMLLARTLDLVNLVDFLHKERDQPIMREAILRRIDEVCVLYKHRFGPLS